MILPSPPYEGKMKASKPNRKRRRPRSSGSRSSAKPMALFLCTLALKHGSAFSPVVSTSRTWSDSGRLQEATAAAEAVEKGGAQLCGEGDELLENLFSWESCRQHDPSTLAADDVYQRQSYPPWLQRYYEEDHPDLGDMPSSFPLQKLQELESLLTANGFSSDDQQDILQTMFFYYAPSAMSQSSTSATALLLGMMDFVNLIVAEHSHFQCLEPAKEGEEIQTATMHCDIFASKPVILAGIVHYAECVAARQDGIYDHLERTLQSSRVSMSSLLTTSACSKALPCVEDKTQDPAKVKSLTKPKGLSTSQAQPGRYPPNLPLAAQKIAASAATIKRAEIMARTIMGVGSTRRLTKDEAEGLQGLLLSSMEDWRSLALRCIASLFRLEGILQQQQQQQQKDTDDVDQDKLAVKPLLPGLRSPEVVHTAQEAILVYGTLAQRLGMHQLKAKIEEKAFQILYQRQYKAVSSVYQQNGNAMQVIRSHLSTQIDALLRSDDSLMTHIESLEVSSRVKEPYSFWKKLLKTKAKQKLSLPAFESRAKVASDLSFAQVQDGIALRVILKAKKESPDEPDETTRAREKLLCYYVQHLIRKQWPGDDDRVKDYIQYPKPNGYQSLHYTAWLTYYTGDHFPFEVQVRSEEMHRIAEYGVAAHWDYKLASSSNTATEKNSPAFALKAADETDEEEGTVVDVESVPDAAKEPEILVGPMSLSSDNLLKVSPPAPNGNAKSPKTPSEILDSDAASKYENLMTNDMDDGKTKKTKQVGYIDALVTARETLMEQRVYVFVAGSASLTMDQGQLLILDSGASIRDALEYVKKETPEILQPLVEETVLDVSNNVSAGPVHSGQEVLEPTIWRNGQPAKMDDVIRNGDVLLLEL